MNEQSKQMHLSSLDGIMYLICRKWGLHIINEIGKHKKLRYSDLMSKLKGISPSTLTLTLKDLEKEKIIKRKSVRDNTLRVEYSLLPLGRELQMAIVPLLKWATKVK